MIIEEIRKQIEGTMKSGKSLNQIGRDTGIDKAALSRIMQGGSCKVETADILFKYFGLTVSKKKNRKSSRTPKVRKMTNEEKVQLRRKWRQWLEHIGNDLGELLTSHDIIEVVLEIANRNKKIRSPNLFLRWVIANYAVRVTVSIRRLSDHDKRGISLYRLIEDISDNPEAVTRSYYVSSYRDKRLVETGLADCDFDNFANRGSDSVSMYKLKRDMKRLKSATDRIRKFTNKWFAHWDPSGRIRRLPTFEDAKEALETIDKIFCKYYLLLKRGGMTTRKPVLQYDWKEPLRHPWIEGPEQEKG